MDDRELKKRLRSLLTKLHRHRPKGDPEVKALQAAYQQIFGDDDE